MTEPLRNWANNLTYSAREVLRPGSVAELQTMLQSRSRIKVLGTGHSFNDIADCEDTLLLLADMPQEMNISAAAGTARASAGLTFGALGAYLHQHGYALPNFASLPHISLAGAYATATHGSGAANPVLAASVVALDLVQADGQLLSLSRATHPDVFDGVAAGLGALGVVVSVTVATVPAFSIRQDVYLGLPFDAALAHLDEILACAYSVSLFTTWRQAAFNSVWCKRRSGSDASPADSPAALFGAAVARTPQHPLPGLDAQACTEQLGRPGPAHERLPHFRMDFRPSHGQELQAEYLLPRSCAVAAFRALLPLQEALAQAVLVTEVRAVAQDTLWMSPAYGRDCVAFHFTLKPDMAAVLPLLTKIEAALAPYEAAAHWGKLFAQSPAEVQARYPRLDDFRQLAATFDPGGKFRNKFLNRYAMG